MKINILLLLVATGAMALLGYRWHVWRNEWVPYWDGYYGSGIAVLNFPQGMLLSAPPGFYAQRKNLPEGYRWRQGFSKVPTFQVGGYQERDVEVR